MGNTYKKTLNLPKTTFPMRADLAKREQQVLETWRADGVYSALLERRRAEGAPTFLLHDGPPYANGDIHHGHILNKTLKDFLVKFKSMKGYACPFVPGWDCHGLPIEHKVDKALGKKKRDMTKVQIRQACRDYADKFVELQKDQFERMMIFADWEDPYTTMSYVYEAKTVRELGRFFDSGLVYRGLRPIHWDWAATTALAEAEVEYAPHTTEHVYVKFPFAQLPPELSDKVDADDDVFVVIWTTTPWTLPANLAVALNPELTYQLVRHGQEVYVVAEGLREQVLHACKLPEAEVEVLASFEGRALVGELEQGKGLKARHPWLERDSVLLPADYVTLEQGTGCVHTAPGHGQEDFVLGRTFDLGVLCPVNQYGKYRESDVPEFANMHVFKANPLISQKLDDLGLLLNEPTDKVTIDRYPHGWRSKKPVIFRATTQWFVAMEPENVGLEGGYRLRDRALESVDADVQWVPSWGRDRIHGMLTSRPDWCISRQRAWGVPITALHCEDCGGVVATKALADHVADLVEQRGVDVWFELEPKELMPEGTTCPSCQGTNFSKEQDILDVWFDSGTSWSAVLESKMGVGDQADLYLEGSDQHRGWFQSSMLCGLVSRDQVPYKTCLTHGFVVDQNGRKLSKSSKNFESPQKMIDKIGAEVLRFWVSATDYKGDIPLYPEVINRVAEAYRKVRNTVRFLLSNVHDFDPNLHMVPLDELEEVDRWMLDRVGVAIEKIDTAYETYQFHTIYHTLVQLTTVELSNVYMDVTKDRMYCELPASKARRSGQTAYWLALDALVRAMAPVLSFTAQEAWGMMPHLEGAEPYVFWSAFPDEATSWVGLVDAQRWDDLLAVRTEVQRALEAKRGSKKDKRPDQIGSSQEADVVVRTKGSTLELLKSFGEDALGTLFIVASVTLEEGEPDEDQLVHADVAPSARQKCQRCWNMWIPTGSDRPLCARCHEVVDVLDIEL